MPPAPTPTIPFTSCKGVPTVVNITTERQKFCQQLQKIIKQSKELLGATTPIDKLRIPHQVQIKISFGAPGYRNGEITNEWAIPEDVLDIYIQPKRPWTTWDGNPIRENLDRPKVAWPSLPREVWRNADGFALTKKYIEIMINNALGDQENGILKGPYYVQEHNPGANNGRRYSINDSRGTEIIPTDGFNNLRDIYRVLTNPVGRGWDTHLFLGDFTRELLMMAMERNYAPWGEEYPDNYLPPINDFVLDTQDYEYIMFPDSNTGTDFGSNMDEDGNIEPISRRHPIKLNNFSCIYGPPIDRAITLQWNLIQKYLTNNDILERRFMVSGSAPPRRPGLREFLTLQSEKKRMMLDFFNMNNENQELPFIMRIEVRVITRSESGLPFPITTCTGFMNPSKTEEIEVVRGVTVRD
jgi:hypothetical protein